VKLTANLSEADILRILADHFEVDPKQVHLHHKPEQRDGPHHSSASFSATVDDVRVLPKGAMP
jgi:hypothetical protein